MIDRQAGVVKVGHSGDTPRRARELGGLTVAYTTEPMADAERIERIVHRLLKTKRIGSQGERYTATVEEAQSAIWRAIRIDQGLEPMIEGGKQVNVRLKPDEVEMIAWLRRNATDDPATVPTVNDVVANAIRRTYESERGDKRAARR